ncbi:unnamed protein product [Cercopithifilaria johnstoni]|uniref:Uncharacterized protein n=1 Tax=Cercopithifilaria johnstoni TaxID=2874296 RepID=A0A8J2M8P8_9BILA|nr:unnamed protein product [Cercopithifilaria johnstoni]
MGNLSPEEILKRIEGDSKGKVKGNQKNGTNGSKHIATNPYLIRSKDRTLLRSILWPTESMMASDHKSLYSYEVIVVKSLIGYPPTISVSINTTTTTTTTTTATTTTATTTTTTATTTNTTTAITTTAAVITTASYYFSAVMQLIDHSSVVANGSKSIGARKRGDKKDRQTDKVTRRPVIIDREVVELSAKMEALNMEKAKAVIVAETTVESKHGSSVMETVTSEIEIVTSSSQSNKVEETGSGVMTATKGTMDEGVDDEEQYLSADEGANSNFSDDIYHTDEQSGASGSRDFISDGANYRADDEEINPLPVATEESEFIQVTTRSKKKGAVALVQHQLAMVPGMDRKNVYFNSTMDRGARTNIRRDADRLRRSSIQLPPDSRKNQPSSRGNTSPSPVDCESGGGKGQTTSTNASVQPQQRRQQHHLKFATSTSTSKKVKYGLPCSLQTSRTTSPDRRGSQPMTLKYSVCPGNNGSSLAVASLSKSLSDTKREIPEQQIGTIAVANTKAPAQRSWADIAKRRLYDNAETRSNEAPHASLDPRSSVKDQHSVSGTSISDHVEGAKKPEHGEQKRTLSVEAINSDPAVKDYSFFFDPNEPTGTVSKETEPKTFNTVPEEIDGDSKSFKPRYSGIVLNLDGGRQVILPESDIIAASPPTIVDVRQRPEVLTANDMWRYFTEDETVVVTYREYKRQKERSQQQDWTSNEQEKKGEITKENEGWEGESK